MATLYPYTTLDPTTGGRVVFHKTFDAAILRLGISRGPLEVIETTLTNAPDRIVVLNTLTPISA